jgi:hypothetical protein
MAQKMYGGDDWFVSATRWMYCAPSKPIMRLKSAHVNGFAAFASGLRL